MAQTRFTVQVASQPSEAEAQALAAQLASAGLPAHWVKAEVPGKGMRYRVRFGRFATSAAARASAEQARQRGVIQEYIVTAYDTPTGTALVAKAAPAKSVPPAVAPLDTQRTSAALVVPPLTPKNIKGVEDSGKRNADKERDKEGDKTAGKAAGAAASGNAAANAPTIAEPPVLDALGELDIKNKNWKVVRKSGATDKALRTVYFYDSMTGWAAGDGGVLLQTTDGGKSWRPQLSGANVTITQIQFVDWNIGWMLGELTQKEDQEPTAVLLTTKNGGRSWEKKTLANVQSCWFADASNGWAVGRNGTLLRTTDGAANWVPYTEIEKLIGLPVESSNFNYGFSSVYFLDTQHGWLTGNFYGRAQTNIGGLFATSDGGATWQRVPLTIQTQYSSGRFTPGMLTGVRFVDRQNGSLTGEMLDGTARFLFTLHTRDGGQTWEQHRTPSRAQHSTYFLDPALGWTAATAPREGGAEAIVFDSTLMRTDNGGTTWVSEFLARGNRIRGLYFLSPEKGWAVGERGMILRYEDRKKH